MIIDNVKVYTPDQKFVEGGLVLDQDRIEAVYTNETKPDLSGKEVLDGEGAYAIPGLIDLHFHGCKGDDFCDNSMEAIERIAEYEASVGVTAIAPATMTLPVEELVDVLKTAAQYKREKHDYKKADLVGINMEGPFISPVKKGAQDDRNILPCDIALCERFLEASEDLVKFVGIAPEESENSLEFIRHMKEKVDISLAHTNADYDTAMAAFSAGANHAVHLYNGMPEILHRAPGVVGAVFDSKHVMTEIICDGIHIHPASVRATFQMMGADRMILISDSMMATGKPDGIYSLGGQEVQVHGNKATLTVDGAIAGSVTNLFNCMKFTVKEAGLPFEEVVACATENPAKAVGLWEKYGSIDNGKYADCVIVDEDFNIRQIVKHGKTVL